MTNELPGLDQARFDAAVAMVGRTGATNFQIRYSDDEEPVVWMAVGEWDRGGRSVYEVGASIDPMKAMFRLLEHIVDGGQCSHCKRPTGITEDVDDMPLDELVCWYQYDPELKTYRRGCEGS